MVNTGSKTYTFRIGSAADVMIDNNDAAPVVGLPGGGGLVMSGSPKNKYTFNLVAPSADTLWYGRWIEAGENSRWDDNLDDYIYTGIFTDGWPTYMVNEDHDDYFVSADPDLAVLKDTSGELKLAEPPTTYTVTYDGNGATSGDVPVDSNSPYISGSTVTVLGNTGNLAKTGYAFVGWNTWSSGYGTDYAPGDTFNINSNTTLYAQWEEYEITSQPVENDPSVGTNADSDIASYQWYKGTMSEVTDTADGVSAYTEDSPSSPARPPMLLKSLPMAS